ncbi:LLM class flavin-dependent oxidoreductase [Arthrobacter ginkgonis]|uniref:LLM class flavin-dependent oxidoreductase n=1 Tax=Arthrobacter ginkgonis TaxID=1630594 RepID=A0ABP7C3A4_9MICC
MSSPTASRAPVLALGPVLALALDGAGWHPAAWRDPDSGAAGVFTAGHWAATVRTAEAGGIDFVTLEDSLGLQASCPEGPDGRTDRVRGRLDALLVANAVAPLTGRIGLFPTVTTTHTEPFHTATGLQTLDYTSRGRAGWQVRVSAAAHEAAHFGRRHLPADQVSRVGELFREAREAVEVARRLWDSWEDDAIIRDTSTGRFIDRDKVHYADFEGEFFSVKGSSITPRSPQGQPLVAVSAAGPRGYALAADTADIVFTVPRDDAEAAATLAAVRAAEAGAGRPGSGWFGRGLSVYADVLVLIEDTPEAARAELERLDALAGEPLVSDARIFAGTAAELADLVRAWTALGFEGFRFRPARTVRDTAAIARDLVPLLAASPFAQAGTGVVPETGAETLRERLGFGRPASRYAASSTTPATEEISA